MTRPNIEGINKRLDASLNNSQNPHSCFCWDITLCLAYISSLEAKVEKMQKALEEIQEGAGPFSMDQLTHAENTIDAMKGFARQALENTEDK